MHLGWVRPISKKLKKYILFNICDFPPFFIYVLFKFGLLFCHFKNTNSVLKYPVFVKTFKNIKTIEKKKTMFLCIWSSVLKLKKKIILCFFIQQKTMFSMLFGFNNQFIKVKRTLARILKTTKILFCLFFSIRGMTLHVIHILDIKFCFFRT
jgi:hypothetical protein